MLGNVWGLFIVGQMAICINYFWGWWPHKRSVDHCGWSSSGVLWLPDLEKLQHESSFHLGGRSFGTAGSEAVLFQLWLYCFRRDKFQGTPLNIEAEDGQGFRTCETLFRCQYFWYHLCRPVDRSQSALLSTFFYGINHLYSAFSTSQFKYSIGFN